MKTLTAVEEHSISLEGLRNIVAGNIPEELCGHEQHNPDDGEMYRCGLVKHGGKVRHGKWGRV